MSSQRLQTTLHRKKSRQFHLNKPITLNGKFLRELICAMLCQDCQTNLRLIFYYAILSGASWTTPHGVLTCAMLYKESDNNVELEFFLCTLVWSLKKNITQGFYLCNIVLYNVVLGQHYTEKILCSVVFETPDHIKREKIIFNIDLILLRQPLHR